MLVGPGSVQSSQGTGSHTQAVTSCAGIVDVQPDGRGLRVRVCLGAASGNLGNALFATEPPFLREYK